MLRVEDRSRRGGLRVSDNWVIRDSRDQPAMPLQVRNCGHHSLRRSVSLVCLQREVSVTRHHHRSRAPTAVTRWGSTSSLSSGSGMSDSTVDLSATEIPILVSGYQKWVTGLTKRTTCDDVIYAVLRQMTDYDVDIDDYKMWERWREVERPLRGRTRILKVWRAWGAESNNVQFYLQKLESPLDTCGPLQVKTKSSRRSRKQECSSKEVVYKEQSVKPKRSKESRSKSRDSRSHAFQAHHAYHTSRSVSPCSRKPPLPPPKQVITKRQEPVPQESQQSDVYRNLVQIILEQEKRLREQSTRIQQTDEQIETYETMMHQLRMKANGRDYVQNAYLNSAPGGTDENHAEPGGGPTGELHSYLTQIESLQERITAQEHKIVDLSVQVAEESFVLEPPDASFSQVCNNDSINVDWDTDAEVSILRQEVEKCMNVSLSQQTHLDLVGKTLTDYDEELLAKRKYMETLYQELQGGRYTLEKVDEVDEEDDEKDSGLSSPNSLQSSPGSTAEDHRKPPPPDPSQCTLPSQRKVHFNLSQNQWCREPQTSDVKDRCKPGDYKRDTLLMPYCTYTSFDWREGKTTSTNHITTGNNHRLGSIEEDNSDTGLSSINSDEPPPVLETLV